ncbi:hypothetical protein [Pseudomonas benzenivorans]|uniref:Lipoprotein n=1 Tax=Pseudomonas benzenivorans TaxID=556533 RepID=A0ABY5HA75_9PSED|nr:hypothetical protein [Pseudomonas benzenivorans]UTW09175.1 hypothetical protein KDW96_07675 [Pseudomonas benzenivorans]
MLLIKEDRQMKTVLAVLVLMLAGCAGQVVNPNVTDVGRSRSISVVDRRPQAEKQAETFSYLISNDAYATYRVDEDAVAPPGTILLRHRAYEKMGAQQPAVELVVHHFVVYSNLQTELRRGTFGGFFAGAIGAVVVSQLPTTVPGTGCASVDRAGFESLASNEYRRALYSLQENPQNVSVYIVFIDTEINGKRVFTRTMMPFKKASDTNSLVGALEAAVGCQLAQY